MSKFIDLNDKSRASNCYSRLNEDAKVASNIVYNNIKNY